MNTTAFCHLHKITLTVARWHDNPNWAEAAVAPGQTCVHHDHWKVTLKKGGRSLTTYFSMGEGHGGVAPEVEDVVDCLASDSTSIEIAKDFEDWASELGWNSDSRTAEKTFKVCKRQAKKPVQAPGERPVPGAPVGG